MFRESIDLLTLNDLPGPLPSLSLFEPLIEGIYLFRGHKFNPMREHEVCRISPGNRTQNYRVVYEFYTSLQIVDIFAQRLRAVCLTVV